jgi:hypothetical protein
VGQGVPQRLRAMRRAAHCAAGARYSRALGARCLAMHASRALRDCHGAATGCSRRHFLLWPLSPAARVSASLATPLFADSHRQPVLPARRRAAPVVPVVGPSAYEQVRCSSASTVSYTLPRCSSIISHHPRYKRKNGDKNTQRKEKVPAAQRAVTKWVHNVLFVLRLVPPAVSWYLIFDISCDIKLPASYRTPDQSLKHGISAENATTLDAGSPKLGLVPQPMTHIRYCW